MRRILIGGLLMLVPVALLLVPWAEKPGAIGIDSTFVLRSAEELHSLQALLRDATVRQDLTSLSETLSLRNVGSRTVPSPLAQNCLLGQEPGAAPPGKVRHELAFADRNGASSRVYSVNYLTCKKAPGEYELEIESQRFGSHSEVDREPVLTGVESLNVLAGAINEPEIASALLDTLMTRSIRYCRVFFRGEDQDNPGLLRFLFVAADGIPGSSQTLSVIRYEVDYHADTGEMTFRAGDSMSGG